MNLRPYYIVKPFQKDSIKRSLFDKNLQNSVKKSTACKVIMRS
ncbi:hypothetical protein X781_16000 [Mannheimia sp. USDA-ARS-USMARC-1261]|nr:hypothetical protein X781_16000 [Mannheimia sp. USDA-ARS-USMARC-1261]